MRKTIFDATKITYNKYSCAISSMSSEMMKMDGRDSAECQNWKRRDVMVILEFVLNDNKTKRNSELLHLKKEKKKTCRGDAGSHFQTFRKRERVFLLSKFLGDPTVGSLRNKKESCSTRRGLRVGTRFREFPQTLRGRGFSLLGFYSSFKIYVNV